MTLRIGTRASELAMWQARHVAAALVKAHGGLNVELVTIVTSGDKAADAASSKAAGKGVFTKEIEEALLAGRVDLAVHSLKDLPTQLPDGLAIAAVLEREDPAEALISRSGGGLAEIPQGGAVMTGSPRRSAQLLHARADLKIVPIRGNVSTRVKKFQASGADALMLACAGLIRLGMGGMICERLDPTVFLPACGQGALAVETRRDDKRLTDMAGALDHAPTRISVTAERAFLAGLGGGCQAPIGAYARIEAGKLAMTVMVASIDGKRIVRHVDSCEASIEAAGQLGQRMDRYVRDQWHGRPARE